MVIGSLLFMVGVIAVLGPLYLRSRLRERRRRDLLAFASLCALGSEARLRAAVEELNLSADAASLGIWVANTSKKTIWASERAATLFDLPRISTQFPIETFLEKIHPDDRERVRKALTESARGPNGFRLECRVLLSNNNVRWIVSRGRFEQDNGNAGCVRGVSVDITDRKDAEEAVHDLSRRLINAQERERAWLARELHDDLSQRFALLSIQVAEIRQNLKDFHLANSHISQLVLDIEQMATDVRRISHDLHPAKLGQLGLEAALRSLCRDLSAAHRLQIDLEIDPIPKSVVADAALCLYRVAQESLQNVIKHSGSERAVVRLKMKNGWAELHVSDEGHGFTMELAGNRQSLGLISINERVRAVMGTSVVSSRPGCGTTVEVRVPLESRKAGAIDVKSKPAVAAHI